MSWLKQFEAEMARQERNRKRPVSLGARAPSGYTHEKPMTIAGKQFVGGQFIPNETLAQATPAERSKLGLDATQRTTQVKKPTTVDARPEVPSPGDDAAQAQREYQQLGTRANRFKAWFGDWEDRSARKKGGLVSKVDNRGTFAPKRDEYGLSLNTVGLSAHAPPGGIDLNGKHFPGGQFIPGKDMAHATRQQLREIHGDDPHFLVDRNSTDDRKGETVSAKYPTEEAAKKAGHRRQVVDTFDDNWPQAVRDVTRSQHDYLIDGHLKDGLNELLDEINSGETSPKDAGAKAGKIIDHVGRSLKDSFNHAVDAMELRYKQKVGEPIPEEKKEELYGIGSDLEDAIGAMKDTVTEPALAEYKSSEFDDFREEVDGEVASVLDTANEAIDQLQQQFGDLMQEKLDAIQQEEEEADAADREGAEELLPDIASEEDANDANEWLKGNGSNYRMYPDEDGEWSVFHVDDITDATDDPEPWVQLSMNDTALTLEAFEAEMAELERSRNAPPSPARLSMEDRFSLDAILRTATEGANVSSDVQALVRELVKKKWTHS